MSLLIKAKTIGTKSESLFKRFSPLVTMNFKKLALKIITALIAKMSRCACLFKSVIILTSTRLKIMLIMSE